MESHGIPEDEGLSGFGPAWQPHFARMHKTRSTMLALKKHIDCYKIQSRKLLKSPLAISFVFWGLLNTALWTPTAMSASEDGAYQIEQLIIARWKLPPRSDGLKVILRYWLARSGAVSFVRVDTTSGNPEFRQVGCSSC
jgi:hypothetical protein